MTLKDNPEYQKVISVNIDNVDYNFYHPAPGKEYHISRFIAAKAHQAYAESGTTRELLDKMMSEITRMCNDTSKNNETLRTDIAVLAENIKYRLHYPVDEDAALRMAAIYTIMENENPDQVDNSWTTRKVVLAKKNPELYAFFLTTGIAFIPGYKEHLHHLKDGEYFLKREEILQSLTLHLSRSK